MFGKDCYYKYYNNSMKSKTKFPLAAGTLLVSDALIRTFTDIPINQ